MEARLDVCRGVTHPEATQLFEFTGLFRMSGNDKPLPDLQKINQYDTSRILIGFRHFRLIAMRVYRELTLAVPIGIKAETG